MTRLLLTILLLCSATPILAVEKDLARELQHLKQFIENRESYIENREHRIESLKQILRQSHCSDEQEFVINRQLIDEYAPYQADSTITYLYRNIELAARTGNFDGLQENRIRLAYFYSAIGSYLEGEKLLDLIDTARLDRPTLVQYYIARHKLHDELQLYSHDSDQGLRSIRLTDFYSQLIIDNCDADSNEARNYRLWQAIRRHQFDTAEAIADTLVNVLPALSRDFASAAYMRALVAEIKGEQSVKQIWFARSAMVDIQLAIRDNAALNSLARSLVDEDISLAMNYMSIVMEDAKFFNSRLRPWQDARVLTIIEQAYNKQQRRRQATLAVFTAILVFCMLLACVSVVFVIRQNRKLKFAHCNMEKAYDLLNQSNDELKSANERLVSLNGQITETSEVKEEYIGIFLMMCSEYIDKMKGSRSHVRKLLRDGKIDELRKEYASNENDEKELKNFYTMFDTTFLRLYPTFIEEFNSLLTEDARIEVKKGEYLTTELRIFALIRLGVTDSSKIAALLRYSVSTIYNYRSKIKYRSNISRDEFEQRLKTIGTFNSQHI